MICKPAFLAACMLTVGSACVDAQAQSQREIWNKPATAFRIIGNIYYVGTGGLASYLITTSQGHVLLDAGLVESAPLIERNIESLGFRRGDIKYLLNSHAHFDHSGGLAELKRWTGAKLVASQGDKSALEGGFYLGSESNHSFDAPPVAVDRAVADGDTVQLADVTLTANVTPGHTRGCTSWSMPVSDGGKTYQVLFFCSSSVAANRLANGPAGPPQYPGIVDDYEKTFARARSFKVDVLLAPHAEFFGLQQKRERMGQGTTQPFVDPTEFAAFMARSEADFRKQLAAQQAAAKSAGPKQ